MAAVWIAACADLGYIASKYGSYCPDTSDEEEYTDPPMPYIRCEHVSSVANGGRCNLLPCLFRFGFWPKAGKETVGEAFWQMIALGLRAHNGA